MWGAQGNIKPSSTTSTVANVGGLNGQIQYNDNGVLNGTVESNYDKTVGMLTLGPVSNVNITGGIPGQVLTKDATGNMMWANSTIPNQPQIHFDVPVTGMPQSFAHANLATFQDSTFAGVFRNGILMPTTAYTINGQVLSINTLLLAGDRVDVLETAAGIVQTGNIGNVNLNGDPTTFLDGTGNWQLVTSSNVTYGTVAPLNLDGNILHWLRGDGVWANIDMPDGNIANINLDGNTVHYLRGDGNWTNIAVPTGNIANTNYNGNADTYLNGQGSWVPVISGGIPGGANTQLQFNNNGVLGGVPNSSFDGANLVLGSNTNIKLTGGNANSVLLTDGTGNLSWKSMVNYAAVPRMEFAVISAGAGQTFTNANLAVYPDSSYATVFRNGVLMDPTDYVISGTNITFPIYLEPGESIDIAASASVGTGSSGGGNGTVSSVGTAGSGLGFTLSGGPITTTGTVTLGVPSATTLRTNLLIGNVANANFNGNANTYLRGNGTWGPVTAVAGNTTEIQYNLNGVLTATNNMRYDTANNIVTFEGVTKLLDDVIVEGDIIPFQSNVYNLGNATHRWKDIYLSNNSVVLGETTLSSENGLKIDGEKAVTAPNDTITIGNIVANTLSGDGSNITGLSLSSIAGAGNIASINLNGNVDQVLAGDGTWTAKSTSAGYINWEALSSGPNQTFTSSELALYSDKTDLSLFRNGVLVTPFEYTLAGTSITISTEMLAGDNLEVISKLVSGAQSGGGGGNVTYAEFANVAYNVSRANVFNAGNIGEIQFGGANGTMTSSTRHFIGANGTGAINASRDVVSTNFNAFQYANTGTGGSIGAYRARGTKASPLPIQVGDTVGGLQFLPYTGNGSITGDNITGFVGGASLLSYVTEAPTGTNGRTGSNVSIVISNAAANALYTAASFNSDKSANLFGNLTVGGVSTLGAVGNVKITGGSNGQALVTDGNGNLSFTTISGGGTITTDSVQLGNGAQALGLYSVAIGKDTYVAPGKDGGVAIGAASHAMNLYTVALGTGSVATGYGSYAIGTNANANADYSMAFGFNSVATQPSSIVLGTSTYMVQVPGKFAIAAGAPASASAAGTAGQIAWDGNFVYVCVATDTWKRSSLTTW